MMKRSERDAIIVLLLVAIVSIAMFPLLGDRSEETTQRFYSEERHGNKENKQQYYAQPEGQRPETFSFDPNTADSTQLLSLGLKPWQVRSIYKYRARGGRYRQKEDFARLYGLTLEDYRRLEPYIHIKPQVMAADVIKPQNGSFNGARGNNHEPLTFNHEPSSKMRYGDPPVDINTADTAELKRIPGIGSYFARRIVELRQRHKAFTSPADLLAIRNFPESALNYMTASEGFHKVHVNSATLQQLRSNPLINYTQAMDIIRYRRTNGMIRSGKELTFLPSFTKEQLTRLMPFLLFD